MCEQEVAIRAKVIVVMRSDYERICSGKQCFLKIRRGAPIPIGVAPEGEGDLYSLWWEPYSQCYPPFRGGEEDLRKFLLDYFYGTTNPLRSRIYLLIEEDQVWDRTFACAR